MWFLITIANLRICSRSHETTVDRQIIATELQDATKHVALLVKYLRFVAYLTRKITLQSGNIVILRIIITLHSIVGLVPLAAAVLLLASCTSRRRVPISGTALVTGATGNVGRALVGRLCSKGVKVIAVGRSTYVLE